MNPTSDFRLALCVLLVSILAIARASAADASAAGTIEGRVFNPATGEYLEFARVTVEGTSLETFTDSSGQYRLAQVPAGTANVKAFRTGLAPQTVSVSVAPG